ncbi:MAG TPA: WYL domain-containing protein, partial [Herpetosiphonaceae bacterium]
SFDYTDKDGAVTKRMIEPYELHFSESSWYLKGFCLHRQGSRTFKVSRIDHLRMDQRTFAARVDWPEQEREGRYLPQFVTIKAWISLSIKDQIIERYGRKSIEDHHSGHLLATIYVPQNPAGFQLLASFGTQLKIIEPQTYVEDFRHYLYQMMEHYP